MKIFRILFLTLIAAIAPAYAGTISTTQELITAMHKKYSNKWYKTLTFVQKNTSYRPDGTTQNSVWYEAMSLPGNLHIDFDPVEKGNGMMFVNNEQHVFRDGKLFRTTPTIHPLMVLGFDVYGQPVETTMNQLTALKFDLTILREDKWQNRKVYVVGAKSGDERSLQFWIDKDRLYLVKTIQPSGQDGKSISETQFNKYQKAPKGGWVAAEVLFLTNGKRVFLEEYEDLQFNVDLSDDLFDPKKWADSDRTYFKKKEPGK